MSFFITNEAHIHARADDKLQTVKDSQRAHNSMLISHSIPQMLCQIRNEFGNVQLQVLTCPVHASLLFRKSVNFTLATGQDEEGIFD